MKPVGGRNEKSVYRAPLVYVGIFYALLVAWTVVSLFFLWPKAIKGAVPMAQLVMIAFVLAYTWYFSLGISYVVRIGEPGNVEMRSLRRVLKVPVDDLSVVEGPRFAILPYGFLKFRLPREKAYVFCHITSDDLRRLLSTMKRVNKKLEMKGI
ncbi:MAG: hypothetical protein JW836_02940 [Deltaproteobacteria bacterium]|nr:hypothetical protein [Deltaproteobacteria bacterium]